MRHLFLMTVSVAALASYSAAAQSPYLERQPYSSAQPKHKPFQDNFPNWYLGLNGTMSFLSDAEVDGNNQSFDMGQGGSAAIGYRPQMTNTLLDNMRFEASLGLYLQNLQDVQTELQVGAPFFNMYYDFNSRGSFRPYVGAGVGAVFARLDNQQRYLRGYLTDGDGDGFADSIAQGDATATPPTVDSPEYLVDGSGNFIPVYAESGDDNDVAFAYQLMAGFGYEFESVQDVEFVMGYRYINSMDMNFDLPGSSSSYMTPGGLVPAGSVAAMSSNLNYQAHNVDVGFRFRF